MSHLHPNPLQKSQAPIVRLLIKLLENPHATVTDEELKYFHHCGWAFVVCNTPDKAEYLKHLYDRAFDLKEIVGQLVKQIHATGTPINTSAAELVLNLIDKQGVEFVDDGFVPPDPNGGETSR